MYFSFPEFDLPRRRDDSLLRLALPLPTELELSFNQLMACVLCDPPGFSSTARQYQTQENAALCQLVQQTLSDCTVISMAPLQLIICEYARLMPEPSYEWLDKAIVWYGTDRIRSAAVLKAFRLMFAVADFGDIPWFIRALTERVNHAHFEYDSPVQEFVFDDCNGSELRLTFSPVVPDEVTVRTLQKSMTHLNVCPCVFLVSRTASAVQIKRTRRLRSSLRSNARRPAHALSLSSYITSTAFGIPAFGFIRGTPLFTTTTSFCHILASSLPFEFSPYRFHLCIEYLIIPNARVPLCSAGEMSRSVRTTGTAQPRTTTTKPKPIASAFPASELLLDPERPYAYSHHPRPRSATASRPRIINGPTEPSFSSLETPPFVHTAVQKQAASSPKSEPSPTASTPDGGAARLSKMLTFAMHREEVEEHKARVQQDEARDRALDARAAARLSVSGAPNPFTPSRATHNHNAAQQAFAFPPALVVAPSPPPRKAATPPTSPRRAIPTTVAASTHKHLLSHLYTRAELLHALQPTAADLNSSARAASTNPMASPSAFYSSSLMSPPRLSAANTKVTTHSGFLSTSESAQNEAELNQKSADDLALLSAVLNVNLRGSGAAATTPNVLTPSGFVGEAGSTTTDNPVYADLAHASIAPAAAPATPQNFMAQRHLRGLILEIYEFLFRVTQTERAIAARSAPGSPQLLLRDLGVCIPDTIVYRYPHRPRLSLVAPLTAASLLVVVCSGGRAHRWFFTALSDGTIKKKHRQNLRLVNIEKRFGKAFDDQQMVCVPLCWPE
jgi:hypothetical protein